MENTDPFEQQLKEILDSGPGTQSPVPTSESTLQKSVEPALPAKPHSGSLIEIIVRVAALIAVIGLLIGFAMRVTSF